MAGENTTPTPEYNETSEIPIPNLSSSEGADDDTDFTSADIKKIFPLNPTAKVKEPDDIFAEAGLAQDAIPTIEGLAQALSDRRKEQTPE